MGNVNKGETMPSLPESWSLILLSLIKSGVESITGKQGDSQYLHTETAVLRKAANSAGVGTAPSRAGQKTCRELLPEHWNYWARY